MQKPTATGPCAASAEIMSAVSATARICNAIKGVTPTSITKVVIVPAQGDR